MLSLLPLLTHPAHALDVMVSHRGYQFGYEIQPGQQIDEVWEGVLPHRRPARRGDLRLLLTLDQADDSDQLRLTIQIDEITRKGTTTVVHPTLVLMPDTNAEFLVGGEVPVKVTRNGEEHAKFIAYGTRVLAGPHATPIGEAAWFGGVPLP